MSSAVLVKWVEKERGMGQRPDGVSFHITHDDADEYIRLYWREQKEINPETPDEYSSPIYHLKKLVEVKDNFYRKLCLPKHEEHFGIRYFEHEWIKYRKHILAC